ncbi:MAG: helix-turn-helix transcriptional regulator [Desulfobacteraceae bacterium]|nr:helix-turn-helix transcriptional regulator [Desulfobacteraceae bacterium]
MLIEKGKKMKFQDKLVKLRKERKWSQAVLCEHVGINITYLSRLENGKSQPSGDMLWKIAKTLGVSMDYFMDEEADEAIPVTIKDKTLIKRLELIDSLGDSDRQTIINVIDSMLTKKKMFDLLQNNVQA